MLFFFLSFTLSLLCGSPVCQIVEVAEGLAKSTAKHVPSQGNVEERPHLFKEGQLCEAHYTVDRLWYPAKVVSVSGDGLLYTVKYVDYDETLNVRASSLREMDKGTREEIEKESRKRAAQEAIPGSEEIASKKKKFKDKKANQEKKNEEIGKKQDSWMNFKNKQKQTKSIFASPETIAGLTSSSLLFAFLASVPF